MSRTHSKKKTGEHRIAWIVLTAGCIIGTGWNVFLGALRQLGFPGNAANVAANKLMFMTPGVLAYIVVGVLVFGVLLFLFSRVLRTRNYEPGNCAFIALCVECLLYGESTKIGLIPEALKLFLHLVLLAVFTTCFFGLVLGSREQ